MVSLHQLISPLPFRDEGQRRNEDAMTGNARSHQTNSMNYVSKQKERNRSFRKQHSNAANPSVQIERRTQSATREPVDPIEDAMDIAIGGEGKPWVERRKAA
jgi:hypothetical protein